MSKQPNKSRHMIEVDLTSMIDVVFQLIIFFMFTSQFGEMRRTEIDLPKQPGDEAQVRHEPAMIIDLTIDGKYYVESVQRSLIEIDSLARAGLAAQTQGEQFDVLVRPDRHAQAVYLDRLLLRLANTGVEQWKLATVDGEGG